MAQRITKKYFISNYLEYVMHLDFYIEHRDQHELVAKIIHSLHITTFQSYHKSQKNVIVQESTEVSSLSLLLSVLKIIVIIVIVIIS